MNESGINGVQKIIYRDPADLRLHPLQKQLPEPDKQSLEWLSFVAGLSAASPDVIPPLIVTRDGLIMDGGRRWRGAKQLQWERVATVERPEAEAGAVMVESLLGQRDLPRGAKIYVLLNLLSEFVKSSEQRRMENLKRGNKIGQKALIFPNLSNYGSGTKAPEGLKDLAERLGVSLSTVEAVARLKKLFDKRPDLKLEYEHQLLSGYRTVWKIEAAIGGALTDQTKREENRDQSQFKFMTDGFDALASSAKFWKRFDEEKQNKVLATWKKTASSLPADLRHKMAEVLNELD